MCLSLIACNSVTVDLFDMNQSPSQLGLQWVLQALQSLGGESLWFG